MGSVDKDTERTKQSAWSWLAKVSVSMDTLWVTYPLTTNLTIVSSPLEQVWDVTWTQPLLLAPSCSQHWSWKCSSASWWVGWQDLGYVHLEIAENSANLGGISHMRPLRTWNVASETEELSFKLNLNLKTKFNGKLLNMFGTMDMWVCFFNCQFM